MAIILSSKENLKRGSDMCMAKCGSGSSKGGKSTKSSSSKGGSKGGKKCGK